MKKRVTIWVDADKYAQLKSELALLNKSIVSWFGEMIDNLIKERK